MSQVEMSIDGDPAVGTHNDSWTVVFDGRTLTGSRLFQPVADLMRASGVPDWTVVVIESGLSWEGLESELVRGIMVSVGGGSLFTLGDGGVDEFGPEEHATWDEVGSYHGVPQMPDQEDFDYDDYLIGWLGRIGSVYFDRQKHSWRIELIGWMETEQEAIDYVCGAEFYFQPY